MAGRLSVPSLQGHVVKLARLQELVPNHRKLSVPSLQGHVVKPGRNYQPVTRFYLSVPSLQGHVVKLQDAAQASSLRYTFSSLFAGTCGETAPYQMAFLQGYVAFSSLFAGTCGETTTSHRKSHCPSSLSVPSLQGHVVKRPNCQKVQCLPYYFQFPLCRDMW